MEPAWDKLMAEFDGHASAGVFDVDCTAAGKPLCDSNGVRGFPTIKHGDPSALEDYKGGRDFDSLQKFASENLKASCSPANIDLCDEEKKGEIEGFLAMSEEDLNASISEKDKEISDAESHFKAEVDKLQSTYQDLQKTKDKTIEEVKNSGLGLMKACKAHKSANHEEL